MLISFAIVQFAPGGRWSASSRSCKATTPIPPRASAAGRAISAAGGGESAYRGAQGLDPEFIKQLEKQFGFDKPAHERS